jgi:hypothetical protein
MEKSKEQAKELKKKAKQDALEAQSNDEFNAKKASAQKSA